MKMFLSIFGSMVVLSIFLAPFMFFSGVEDFFISFIDENFLLASVAYIGLIVVSVLLVFFNVPLFYIAGGLWGAELAIVYNLIGWSIGSAIAFYVARRYGVTLLSKMKGYKMIKRYEKHLPVKYEFLGVVFLRMIMPVDVLSYALGLFSRMRFSRYMLATIIGTLPFTIISAYGGHALFEGDFVLFSVFVGIAIIAGGVGVYVMKVKWK